MKNPMLRLLRSNANLRNLWLGESLSNFGDFFYDVAIAWIVFTRTGSATQSGLMLVAAFVPQVMAGPFLGAIADRLNRKHLMVGAGAGQALLTGLLTLLIALNKAQMWEVYAITVFLSLGQCLYGPARSGMFPDIVEKSELMTGNSLFSSSQQFTRIIGSVGGGAIMAWIGPEMSIGLNALSFVAVVFFVWRIQYKPHTSPNASAAKTSLWHDMREGWAWLTKQPVLLTLILIGTVSNVALGPTNVLPPIFIKQSLHGSAFALGAFDAAIGLGVLLGGIVLGSLAPKRVGLFFSMGLGLQGFSMGVVSLSHSIVFACLGNFVLGVAVIMAGLPMGTMFQLLIPAHIRGRVSAMSSTLFTVAIPLTYGGVGILADIVGPRWCYAIGACLLALCILVGISVPTLRRLTMGHNHDAPAVSPAQA